MASVLASGSAVRMLQSVRRNIYNLAHRAESAIFSASLSHYKIFNAAGLTGHYRIYRGELDLSRPVGVLFYFDGDYSSLAFSRITKNSGLLMSKLTDIAAHYNMIFVPVLAPVDRLRGYTTNWWVTSSVKSSWFWKLYQYLFKLYPLDSSRIWFSGYSGGAEFITYELLGSDNATPAGASIIAGGGVDRIHFSRHKPLTDIPLTWHVGERDRGIFAGFGWSAYAAAQSGRDFFQDLGAHCNLHVLPHQNHFNYPIANLVNQDLALYFPVAQKRN